MGFGDPSPPGGTPPIVDAQRPRKERLALDHEPAQRSVCVRPSRHAESNCVPTLTRRVHHHLCFSGTYLSRRRESNPGPFLTKEVHYHYAMTAGATGDSTPNLRSTNGQPFGCITAEAIDTYPTFRTREESSLTRALPLSRSHLSQLALGVTLFCLH
jgi:hypothetical protein